MFGEKTLSNSELLAIIIKTGTKEQTAIGLAQNILAINPNKEIRSLQEISLQDLKKIKGIGRVKAIQIKAVCEIAKRMKMPLSLNTVIKTPKDVADLLIEELRYEKREIVKLLILNTKNVVRKILDITVGEESSARINIKTILEETLKTGMTKFILVHNHPSGNCNPSNEDIETTKNIENASKIVGLQLLDHIIIGDGTFYSIYANQTKDK
ncbi:MAG: DNA repair protein RadC [Clostridiaceae bacterium]|nr:DNA repair protein RadC [Clostridiaceae bacterium]